MHKLSRRKVLAVGAVAPAGLSAATQARARDRPALTRAVEEGPYYLPDASVRTDISEGLPGVPVEIRFEVLDETGAPLPGARVDVWHCDAQGRYSGFGTTPGEAPDANLKAARFLRGVQPTSGEGLAVFRTVYPGWYMGRTTHIHFKIWLNKAAVLTSQGFLPDALNEFLYIQDADYRREQTRDMLNSSDRVARQAGELGLVAIKDAGDRYVVIQTVVVDRAARPVPEHGPRGPGGPPGFGPSPGDSGPPPAGLRPPWFAAPGPPRFGPHGGGPFGPTQPPLTGEARLAAILPGDKRGA